MVFQQSHIKCTQWTIVSQTELRGPLQRGARAHPGVTGHPQMDQAQPPHKQEAPGVSLPSLLPVKAPKPRHKKGRLSKCGEKCWISWHSVTARCLPVRMCSWRSHNQQVRNNPSEKLDASMDRRVSAEKAINCTGNSGEICKTDFIRELSLWKGSKESPTHFKLKNLCP